MKIRKRCLALLVAMVMTVTAFVGNGAIMTYANGAEQIAASEETEDESVPADTVKEESAEQGLEVSSEDAADELNTDAIENVVHLFEALPAVSDLSEMSPDEIDVVIQQTTEAINAFDALGNKECDYIIDNYPELYDDVMNKLSGALAELQQGGMETMSLLPLEEVKAQLVLDDLRGYIDISNVPLGVILNYLMDEEGNFISVDPEATMAWEYRKDEDDGLESYVPYVISENPGLDLSRPSGISYYNLELIVGDDGPLNNNNVRYNITVYLTSDITSSITYDLYTQTEEGYREEVIPKEIILNGIRTYLVPEHVRGTEYYLGINAEVDNHPYVKTNVYLMSFYGQQDITDQILNQDMTKTDAGYKTTLDQVTTDSILEYKFFRIVMTNSTDGSVLFDTFTIIQVVSDTAYVKGEMLSFDGGDPNVVSMYEGGDIRFKIEDESISDVNAQYYMLKEGFSADEEYYFSLNAYSPVWEGDANRYVAKAVVGLYTTWDEAAAQEDIQDQLIPEQADKPGSTYGYKANYNDDNGGQYFTVFFKKVGCEDDTVFTNDNVDVWRFKISVIEYDPKYDFEYVQQYTDKPVIGEADPWFRVTGATDINGNEYDTYVVENGKNINMDTYYGYGYQTIFINDADADLSQLKPKFWYANTDRVYAVSNDSGDRVDEDHVRDFSEENQQYTGIILDNDQENERNYWVTFKKLNNNGPELYVYGPSEREVILDEYFEFKHDILIANIGNEPLEDISVELVDAENVKLDSYWNVGGEGNDTLAPFTATSSNTQYGELANLAKIRLLPDGEGEVKGTLIISAKDQDPVMITLNGTAQNPEIITETLSDAVKYVPYQQIVATNNMHDWVETQFSIVDGKLPEGVTLNSSTGEIYGVPKVPEEDEEVTYTFTVEAKYTVEGRDGYFEPSRKKFTLTVKPNTDENVYLSTDSEDGYAIEEYIGTQTGEYSFELENIEDTLFVSGGEYGEFVGLWLNGELLEPGVDYDSESGSTRVTIKAQTFENKTTPDGTNTIAMEFRKDTNGDGTGDSGAEMNRTAQNFTVKTESNVDSVIEKIAALPSNITLNDKSAVQSARSAYNALSSSEQARVTNRQKLFDAEARIAQLEADRAAADQVIAKINAIPAMINFEARDEIEAARAAYNDLTAAQKNLVTNYNRLITAENAFAQYEKDRAEAGKVVDLINALPDSISLDDKDAVNSARAAYNILTAAQKGYVTNYSRLQAAEERIIELEAEALEQAQVNSVIAEINALPYPVTLDDKDAVEAVRTAYDALTSAQKARVINYNTLAAAESTIAALEAQEEADKIDKDAAEAVIELIDAIPDDVSLTDKPTVEAARTAYDGLTENQKKLVANYYKLINAETVIQTLEDYENATDEDRAAADKVIDLINTLPEEITLEDKPIVESVRTAYEALTDNQKKIVINYQILINAEVRIAELEDENFEEVPSVTFVGIVVDKDGNALSDRIVEMHSSVQTARTDENGSFQFNDVEFGTHTIFIKDANGNIITQREFNIIQGSPLALNGNDIVAENGSIFTVRMMVDGSDLIFLNVEEGNKAPAVELGNDGIYIGEADQKGNTSSVSDEIGPDTGDYNNFAFWIVLLFGSFAGLSIIICLHLKKRTISCNKR